MESTLLTQAIDVLAPAAGGLLLAIISWLLAEAARYVRSRTQNEAVNDAIARICHMVETTVTELNQTVVDDMKKLSVNGTLSADDAQRIKANALALVQARMAPGVLAVAARGVNDLAGFIAGRIERAVREQHA